MQGWPYEEEQSSDHHPLMGPLVTKGTAKGSLRMQSPRQGGDCSIIPGGLRALVEHTWQPLAMHIPLS